MAQANVIQGHFPGALPRFVNAPAAVQPKMAAGAASWVQDAIARGAGGARAAQMKAAAVSRVPQPARIAAPPRTHLPAPPQPHRSGAVQLPVQLASFPRGGGRALPLPVRQMLERTFRANFADVRVHVGPHAASIGATAFTHGSNVYFAPGQCTPYALGRQLAHVVQQRSGRVANPFGGGVAIVQDRALGAEAARMGRQVARTVQRITDKDARRHLGDEWLDAYGRWKDEIGAYGHELGEESLVERTLAAIEEVSHLRQILTANEEHHGVESDVTVESLAVDAKHLLEQCALTAKFIHQFPQEIENIVILSKRKFELNYLTIAQQSKPEGIAHQAARIALVKGYETNGTSHLRKSHPRLHYAVHEIVHAMAVHDLKARWGGTACEGATEMITLRVLASGGADDGERVYVEEQQVLRDVMKQTNLTREKLVDFYFTNPDAFLQHVGSRLDEETLEALLSKSAESYLLLQTRKKLDVLEAPSFSFKPKPKQERHSERQRLIPPQPRQSSACCCSCCFLTTACVEAKGLPDDCRELETLRAFRDAYVAALPDGGALIGEYYRIAPAIVSAMRAHPEAPRLFRELYESLVARCVALIDEGRAEEAMANYRAHVEQLKETWLGAIA